MGPSPPPALAPPRSRFGRPSIHGVMPPWRAHALRRIRFAALRPLFQTDSFSFQARQESLHALTRASIDTPRDHSWPRRPYPGRASSHNAHNARLRLSALEKSPSAGGRFAREPASTQACREGASRGRKTITRGTHGARRSTPCSPPRRRGQRRRWRTRKPRVARSAMTAA